MKVSESSEVNMNLDDINNRSEKPIPWTEGEKIPWDEPAFSQRMLREHLSQDHDAASRRFALIDQHVEWIHKELLKEKPSRLLDLGCGPGFYVSRLARLGHTCTGVDFSPASIAYAQQQEEEHPTGSAFIHHDLRNYEYGSGYDLVMLIYGEFNTFLKPAARNILMKARKALNEDGRLLIELNSFSCLHSFGLAAPEWHTSQGGLFSDHPHLFLEESFWNDELKAATRRMYVVDSASGEVQQFADNHQAYTEDDLRNMAADCGFSQVEFHANWPGNNDDSGDYLLMVCKK
jgi:SAM-dependent methyltransferase